MADSKLTALTENTTPAGEDLLYTVDDPSGTPTSKKLTIASLQSKVLPDVYLVSDYGATGDGVTDDSTALQNCIDAATGNGMVYVEAGTYNLGTTGLTIDGYCPLIGASVGATVLKYTGTGVALHINSGGAVTTQRFEVGNFTLDGDDTGDYGIQLGQASTSPKSANVILYNILATGFETACFRFNHAQICEVYSCWTHNNNGDGFWFEGAAFGGNTTVSLYACKASACKIGLLIDQLVAGAFYDFVADSNDEEGVKVNKVDAYAIQTISFENLYLEGNNAGVGRTTGYGDFYSVAASDLHDVTINGLYGNNWTSDYLVLIDKGYYKILCQRLASPTGAIRVGTNANTYLELHTIHSGSDIVSLGSVNAPVTVHQYGNGANLPFVIWANNNGTMAATLAVQDGSGGPKVGVGTTTPAQHFHVYATGNATMQFEGTTGSRFYLKRGANSGQQGILFQTSTNTRWGLMCTYSGEGSGDDLYLANSASTVAGGHIVYWKRSNNATAIGGHTESPTAFVDVKAATTGLASIRIRGSGAVNPSSPNEGDLWFDGTNLKFYDGSTTKTLSWT